MSDRLSDARRAHAAEPCRSTAERLDLELRRAGDGPWLPDVSWRLSQFHAMTANLFLRYAVDQAIRRSLTLPPTGWSFV